MSENILDFIKIFGFKAGHLITKDIKVGDSLKQRGRKLIIIPLYALLHTHMDSDSLQ